MMKKGFVVHPCFRNSNRYFADRKCKRYKNECRLEQTSNIKLVRGFREESGNGFRWGFLDPMVFGIR